MRVQSESELRKCLIILQYNFGNIILKYDIYIYYIDKYSLVASAYYGISYKVFPLHYFCLCCRRCSTSGALLLHYLFISNYLLHQKALVDLL